MPSQSLEEPDFAPAPRFEIAPPSRVRSWQKRRGRFSSSTATLVLEPLVEIDFDDVAAIRVGAGLEAPTSALNRSGTGFANASTAADDYADTRMTTALR
jgi:hypothetical protein